MPLLITKYCATYKPYSVNYFKYKNKIMHKSNKSIYIRNENPVALIVSSYQPNKFTSDVLRSCINSYLRINNQNASLWIVDVGSPNH